MGGKYSVKKQYVRYRLILESDTAKQQPTDGTGMTTGHTFMTVDQKMRQGNLSDEQAIKLFQTAGKVISAPIKMAAKLSYNILKSLGSSVGKWIKTCINEAIGLARGTLRGALKSFTSKIMELVKGFWGIVKKSFSDAWTGLATLSTALITPFKNAIARMLKRKTESTYVVNFGLSNRTMRILNEASNNPIMIRGILNKIIEKAKAACRNLYNLCVKSNAVKKLPKLAGMVGLITILICGHPNTSAQTTAPQNVATTSTSTQTATTPNNVAVTGAN